MSELEKGQHEGDKALVSRTRLVRRRVQIFNQRNARGLRRWEG